MRRIYIILCFVFGFSAYAQIPNMPDSINYQAVLRDASGNVLPPGTTGTLNFKIYSDFVTNTPNYEENHSFTTNAVGLVNLYIGGGVKVGSNTFANVNWATGNACYQVSLDGTPIGPKQAFAAVPYALYAKTSGAGSLPPGLPNQTLYFDQTSNLWKATNNLANDGFRVGIGVAPNSRIKLHVASNDVLDSTMIFATKLNANSQDALYRGIISGSTNTTAANPFAPVIGADIRSLNSGNGYAIGIGSSAQVINSGTAIAMSAVAKGPPTATLAGLYAAADTLNNPNAYAAIFDRGKVAIGDVIVFPNSGALPGSVYKIDAQKRGYWSPAAAANININQGGIVSVNPNGPGSSFTVSAQAPVFQSTGLGSITLASYPNYIFNLPAPTFSFNSGSGLLTYNQGTMVTTVNLSPALTIASGTLLNVAGSNIGLPALGFWTKPTGSTLVAGNTNDYVGIGTTTPTEKLVVQSGANTDVSFVGTASNYVSLNFGTTANHMLGKIHYTTNNDMFNFSTAGVNNRLVITGTGNVGIGISTPGEMLHVNGNAMIPPTNEYMYSGTKTKYLSLPSAAFDSENADTYAREFISGHLYVTPAGGTVNCPVGLSSYFQAPVYLPQGATVTAVEAFVVDGDATYDISLVQLWRVNSPIGSPFGTANTMAATPATTGSSPNIQLLSDNTITNAVIDNQGFYYYVRYGGRYTGPGAAAQNIRLARVVITYNINKAD